MLKSKIFNFYEDNLQRDINEFECATGRRPEKLECNTNTGILWSKWVEIHIPFVTNIDEQPKGILCEYRGIPVKINDLLDDGTINMK